MIDYGKGYSSTWSLLKVDPSTWAGCDEVGGLLSASVERDRLSGLLESGSAQFDSEVSEGEFYGRIEMLAEQDGEVERHPIATLLFSPGDSTASRSGIVSEYAGRSVLAPAADRVLLAGSYVPAGTDGAAYAASLVAACTPAPVTVEGSFTVSGNYVFAQGTTYLEAAWGLLDGAGWQIRITGGGAVSIGPKPQDASLVLDDANASLLGTEVGLNGSLDGIPNRYIAVDGDARAIALDMSDGPTSYPTRGRYVDVYDESPQLCNGEGLEAYAERRLAEATASIETRTYTREWWPDVTCGDIVKGSIGAVGLDCTMRVKTQSVQIGRGALVTEEAEVLR